MTYDNWRDDPRVWVPPKLELDSEEDEVVWEAECPFRCGVISHSWATRHNTRKYGVRMSVLSHLRNIHNLRGRELSVKADEAVRHLPG